MASPVGEVTKRTRKYLLALIVGIIVASSQPNSVTTLSAESSTSARQALALVNQQRAEARCASLWLVAKLLYWTQTFGG